MVSAGWIDFFVHMPLCGGGVGGTVRAVLANQPKPKQYNFTAKAPESIGSAPTADSKHKSNSLRGKSLSILILLCGRIISYKAMENY